MKPDFPYRFNRTSRKATLDNGEKVQYNDVKLKRKYFGGYVLASALFGFYMVNVARYSRWWYFGAFVPAILIKMTDFRNIDYTEIENFYKYVEARRKADYLEKLNSSHVTRALSGSDNNAIVELKDWLLSSNKTVYDVTADLDAMYLKAAADSLHK
jgi:hypothetical protein